MKKILKMISLGILLLSVNQIFAQAPGKHTSLSNDWIIKSMSFNIRNGYANDKENRWAIGKSWFIKLYKIMHRMFWDCRKLITNSSVSLKSSSRIMDSLVWLLMVGRRGSTHLFYI